MIDLVLNKELGRFCKEFGFRRFVDVKIMKASEDFRKKVSGEKLVVVEASKKFLRNIFENGNVDVVVGLGQVEEKDSLHYRNSGLNQVLCNLARKNKISVGFNFDSILNSKERGKMLGRMMQNVRLCKKYKVNMVLGSFAKDKWGLRMRKDLEAFGRLIGIDKLDNEKIFKLKEFSDVKVVE